MHVSNIKYTVCGGNAMFFAEERVGQKVTRSVVVACGACGCVWL